MTEGFNRKIKEAAQLQSDVRKDVKRQQTLISQY